MNDSSQVEMPKYKSHKEVWALKLCALEIHYDRSATIVPEDDNYAPIKTRVGWADRFEGGESDHGYYVVYADGFTSWSPSEAFEDGYTRIDA